jgi:hypothetical protein
VAVGFFGSIRALDALPAAVVGMDLLLLTLALFALSQRGRARASLVG